jgi:hypothetical protein
MAARGAGAGVPGPAGAGAGAVAPDALENVLSWDANWRTNPRYTVNFIAANVGRFDGFEQHAYGSIPTAPSLLSRGLPFSAELAGRNQRKEHYADSYFEFSADKIICLIPGCVERVVSVFSPLNKDGDPGAWKFQNFEAHPF